VIVFLALIAAILVLWFLVSQRRHDETWQRYIGRFRRPGDASDNPPDPNFQFEERPDAAAEKPSKGPEGSPRQD
jgi:hypothetical protein